MSCNKKLSLSLATASCDVPLVGVEDGVILNYTDIDGSSTVVSGATVTALNLVSGATGYPVSWFRNLASTASTFESSDDAIPSFKHSFLSRLNSTSAESAEISNQLAYGRFVMVVRTRFEGVGQKDRYKVYGIRCGLVATEISNSSVDADGAITFTLASDSVGKELYPYSVFLEGDDAAISETSYKALFATV